MNLDVLSSIEKRVVDATPEQGKTLAKLTVNAVFGILAIDLFNGVTSQFDNLNTDWNKAFGLSWSEFSNNFTNSFVDYDHNMQSWAFAGKAAAVGFATLAVRNTLSRGAVKA